MKYCCSTAAAVAAALAIIAVAAAIVAISCNCRRSSDRTSLIQNDHTNRSIPHYSFNCSCSSRYCCSYSCYSYYESATYYLIIYYNQNDNENSPYYKKLHINR
jgi:hypothetical protein